MKRPMTPDEMWAIIQFHLKQIGNASQSCIKPDRKDMLASADRITGLIKALPADQFANRE